MKELTEPQKLWIAALRSGIYGQTKSRLQDATGYCCLGVACRVAEVQGVSVNLNKDGLLLGGSLYVQEDVQKWLRLKTEYGHFQEPGNGLSTLAMLNDEKDYSFNQLADFIEQNAEKLFV